MTAETTKTAVVPAKRLYGHGYEYTTDPEGLDRMRQSLLETPDWHDRAPINCNSLARLLDTIALLQEQVEALANRDPQAGEARDRFAECYENGAHPNCRRCDRGEVPNMADDSGFWVEMGAVAGGANEHGMRGWIELIEHHPDGREVRREYVATDSPLYASPQDDRMGGAK